MWDVMLDGPYVPMKTGTGVEALVPNLQSEWSESEVKRVQVNFKATNTLHCALNPLNSIESPHARWQKQFGIS